ncbi:MAG: M67 family metallopeptidase [Acidobacteriota bacterium]
MLDGLIAEARAAAPRECCGLLIGTSDRIVDAVTVPNTHPDPERRYTIGPADHFAAVRRARRGNLQVVGAYHSHPRGPDGPSPTDLAEAFPDFLFLIISLASEPPSVTGWRLEGGNFVRAALVGTGQGTGVARDEGEGR